MARKKASKQTEVVPAPAVAEPTFDTGPAPLTGAYAGSGRLDAAVSAEIAKLYADLTPQMQGWVRDYIETGNQSEAARRNYKVTSDESARVIGSQMRRHKKVKKLLDALVHREAVCGLAEAVHIISDHARATADDYITLVPTVRRPLRLRPVREVLKELEDQIAFEKEYIHYANLLNKERDAADKEILEMERKAIRYRLMLARDENAMVEAYGPPEEVLEPVADLAKAKRRGKMHLITSVKRDRAGRLQVETVDRQAALNTLLKIHGALSGSGEESQEGKSVTNNVQINNYWNQLIHEHGG